MAGDKRRTRQRGNSNTSNNERTLWVNVVLRAIQDATEGTSDNRELHRQQARNWFNTSNRDFIEVCNLAGLDPEATAGKALSAIKRYDAIMSAGEAYSYPGDATRKPRAGKPRRKAKTYTANGKAHTLSEWSEITGINRCVLQYRLKGGASFEEAISQNYKRKARTTRTNEPASTDDGVPGVVSNSPETLGTGAGSFPQAMNPENNFPKETAE